MESSDPTTKLCEVCSQLNIQLLVNPIHPCRKPLPCIEPPVKRRNVGPYLGYLPLGSIDAVKNRRSTCDICGIIAEHLDNEPSGLVGEYRISECENYCTFTLPGNISARDRRITHFHLTQATVIFDPPPATQVIGPILPWEYKMRDDSASRYILHLQTKTRSCPELEDFVSATPQLEEEFFATVGGRYVGTKVDTELVRAWLHQCEREHGKDCTFSIQLLMERYTEPALVVDVVQWCLVDTPSKCRYVALSYVWGRAAVFRHLLENTHSLRKPGCLCSLPIPATIRDAITLVHAIGERYLWVDSLCIIQDDLQMQQTEISRMGSIYSNALFTIIAASGDHANAGLPGVAQGSREQTQKTLKRPDCELLSVIDIRLTPSGISDTTWAQRAWTFQERTLSNRALVFSENQVYWSCRVESHSEERALEKVQDVDRLHNLFPQYRDADTLPRKCLQPLEYCQLYDDLLYIYRQRHLTYETDILNAFNGVTEMLGALQSDRFFWGLPRWFFSYALTWGLTGHSSRNNIAVPIFRSNDSKEIVPIPSWSWAAWSGKDSYHQRDLIDGHGDYVRPLIQFNIVDNNYQLVAIEEQLYPGPNYSSDDLRTVLQHIGAQSQEPPSLPPQPHPQIGQLCFWTSHGTAKVIRSWSPGLGGMIFDILSTPDLEPGLNATGSEIVYQDFIVVAGQGITRLVLLAIDWIDGVAYRVGKTWIKATEWALVKNRQWRLITLG